MQYLDPFMTSNLPHQSPGIFAPPGFGSINGSIDGSICGTCIDWLVRRSRYAAEYDYETRLAAGARETSFAPPLCAQKPNICQDRLGIEIQSKSRNKTRQDALPFWQDKTRRDKTRFSDLQAMTSTSTSRARWSSPGCSTATTRCSSRCR
jgi:hypothetical protein